VLLVDDDQDSREAMRLALARGGHQAHAVDTGRSAIARAIELRPDAIVIDIVLPDLDGYTVAAQIRARLGTSVRLIAVTGFHLTPDHPNAAFDVHLVKPVEPDALLRAVDGPMGA
jgi:CheY-like chemotaxis protein